MLAEPADVHGQAFDLAANRARKIVSLGDESVVAVLFYGSHANGVDPAAGSALDFVVIVTQYRGFFRALGAAGRIHRPVWLLNFVSTILPPSSIAFRSTASEGLLAKCLVISQRDFARALGPQPPDHFLVARMCQSVVVLWSRDQVVESWIQTTLHEVRDRVLLWTGPYLKDPFDASALGELMIALSYGTELRPEPRDRAARLFAAQRDQLVPRLDAVLAGKAVEGILIREETGFRFARPVTARERRFVDRYFARSRLRSTVRWLSYVITFEDWLTFATRKIERHTGEPIHLSVLERRWPFLFLWPRLIRVLRLMKAKETRHQH